MYRSLFLLAFTLLCAGPVRAQPTQPAPAPSALLKSRGETPLSDPVPFAGDGVRRGWKLVFPGQRPLTTPAVVDGRLFLGGGFGSHDFYALDAVTGKKLWQYRTRDDSPTAPVVAEGHVVFSTEGAELTVLTVEGRLVWKKWLGDPQMSMPAVADSKVVTAYPEPKGGRRHFLACFDLKTGNELWSHPIAGEVITAPVIDSGRVYLSTLDGTLYSFTASGVALWSEPRNATCAPVVWDSRCLFTCRDEAAVRKDGKSIPQQQEALAVKPDAAAARARLLEATRRDADYLDYAKRGGRSIVEKDYKKQDYDSGFGHDRNADLKVRQAMRNLGQNSVVGVWSYQGSRPVVAAGRIYTAMGDTVECLDARTERRLWRKEMHAARDKGELLDAGLTPPAVVNGKLFLGTSRGELLCLSAATGEKLWSVALGEPVAFQPVVARGRAYVATNRGTLFCVETGDPRDDGWLMWGANPAHTGAALTK